MTIINVVTLDGTEQKIDATIGESVMAAIHGAGIDDLAAICGGSCSCATCHVWIDPAWTARAGPPGDIENELLDGSLHRHDASRLSCQIVVSSGLDGLRVTIAPAD